jgi:hypothetical protein
MGRAIYTPGDGLTSPAYSSHSVQCLYINHVLSVNKLVLSAPLLWVRRGSLFHLFSHSTTAPTRSWAAAPAPSPSELGRGTRLLLSAALRLSRPQMPRVAVADSRTRAQAVFPQPSGSRFKTRWFLHRRDHASVPESFFYPTRRFFHARDLWRLRSLHRHCTRPISGHGPRGWTSDL